MKKRAKNIIFLAGIFCVLLFASCSSKASASSLTSMLDEADRYIAQGYPNDALKVLGKAQKKIYSPIEAIGIYKRYIALDEKRAAEKFILKALKKNPDNLELNAVYTHFLKKDGRFEQALKRAEILNGTKYGSLYSELVFRALLEQEHGLDFYLGEDFKQIYYGAYSTSLDNSWLRNLALISLARGEYVDAASFVPMQKKSASDSYFWACVLYDAANYGDAAETLLNAERLLNKNEVALTARASIIPEKTKISGIEISSLLSDSYINMGEDEAAEKVRSDLIARLMLGSEDAPDEMLAAMYLNSALYAQQNENLKAAFNNLTFVVQKWPDYVPALIAYGNFAYQSARRVLDDPLTQALRDAGVVSADMKRFDELPRVQISDALLRMKESLERTKDESLYVAILDLEDKIEKSSDERVRFSKVWRLLEKNTISTNLYPSGIMQYALYTLLSFEKYDEARDLFKKYLNARFGFDAERPFEEEVVNNVRKMYLWEVEYAAYFAAAQNNASLAKRLYEYAVYESGGRGNSEISPACAVQSAVNLAMVYSSTGNKDKALELYGRAGGRATDNYLKSEIMYRLGSIYDSKDNKKDALRSLEYSLYLNPSNGRAYLLLNDIKER